MIKHIGDNTYINSYTHIRSGLHINITIGKYWPICNNVHIRAKTHELNQPSEGGKQIIEKDIRIDD